MARHPGRAQPAMSRRAADSSSPPVRDAASLKAVNYGPGHEKFPSWPGSCEQAPGPGGPHRCQSWADHTSYPKEQAAGYSRPHAKRANSAFTQQLKTVMERCERIPLEVFEPRAEEQRVYLPRLDREGKTLGDSDYMVPSPPERDVVSGRPQLTQADLEEYARSYQDPSLTQVNLEEYVTKPQQTHLTRAELEEYSRAYDDALRPTHQQQPSYAQSEGYHSYVSSTDSTTNTPFLDRLRRDSEVARRPAAGPQVPWDDGGERDRPGRDSVATTSSGSASSSETLKWHGSLSDVSSAGGSAPQSRRLIAHSARVQTPQRHHSESVLYLGGGECCDAHNRLRLFPVNTYTVQPPPEQPQPHRPAPVSPQQSALSVAERICELEKQQKQQLQTRYTYLDPDKRHRVSDPTLKAIQKKALLSFYERHHSAGGRGQAWRSEPQLAQPVTMAACPQSPPPQPPPRPRPAPAASSRRASSASDYAGGSWREMATLRENSSMDQSNMKDTHHQHSSSCGSLSADLLGPLIVGPSICVDDWVPERPPKKPHLRAAFPPPVPDRMPSPDLPPPSPPTVLEDEVFNSEEPLPPPPPELAAPDWAASEAGASDRNSLESHNGPTTDGASQIPTNADSVNVPLKYDGSIVSTQKYFEAQQKHADGQTSYKTTENSALPVNCPTSQTQSTNMPFRHSEYTVQDKAVNSAGGPLNPENSISFKLQENSAVNPRYPDNKFSAAFRQSDTSFMNHVSNNRHNSNSQRHQWSSNFIQRSLDSVTSSQRYLENGPVSYDHQDNSRPYQRHNHDVMTSSVQRHHASAYSPTKHGADGHRYSENGFSSSRYKYGPSSPQRPQQEEGSANQKQGITNVGATNPKNNGNVSVHRSDSKSANKQGLQKPLENGLSNGHSYVGSSVPQRHSDGSYSQNISNSSSVSTSQPYRSMNVSFKRFSSMKHTDNSAAEDANASLSRFSDGARASLRYPTQKLMVNGKLATSLSEWAPASNVMSRSDGNRGSVRVKAVMEPCRARLQRVPAVLSSREVSQPLHGSQSSGRVPESTRIPMVQSNKEVAQITHCCGKVVESAKFPSVQTSKDLPQPVLIAHTCSRVLDSSRGSVVQSSKVQESGRVPLVQRNKEGVQTVQVSIKVPESSRVMTLPSCKETSLSVQVPQRAQDSAGLSPVHSNKEVLQPVPVSVPQSYGKEPDLTQVSCPQNSKEVPQSVQVPQSSNKILQSTRVSLVLSSKDTPQPALSSHNPGSALESTKVPLAKSSSESSQLTPVPCSPDKLSESPRVPSPADENGGLEIATLEEDQQSTSKASYLAQRRDRDRGLGLPDCEGSYKRTMSPSPASGPLVECDRVASCGSLAEGPELEEAGTADDAAPPPEPPPPPAPAPAPAPLQLLQRSEVVLRVGAATSDAASQTELDAADEPGAPGAEGAEGEATPASPATPPPRPARHKLQEEIDCERLSLDLASSLSPSDRLQGILVPGPDYKKVTDYVSGLFRLDIPARPRASQRPATSTAAQHGTGPPLDSNKDGSNGPESPLPANSAYFTTSESKAKFLTRYSRDMSQSEQVGAMDLHRKKEELMSRLDRKLEVLREERRLLGEESRLNEELGDGVAGQVARLARPHEAAKYRLHVEEVGKVASLLLGLSGRLARAENALAGLAGDHAEKKILESKRDKLKEQLDEAKKLKENIDRRSVHVSKILYKYFNEEEYADYDHFINMKAKLIMDSREIADKIKLGEEQLAALKETLTSPD
ncbi:uncharacterized protein LOC134545119 [Bacillus rossius redtenbacheri]|uniref:uncharacterized protein LOC134545119 n=1 Tax=Bacillus rossius redtenbacheri TaxID=93214 RepID=UPI002FDCF227